MPLHAHRLLLLVLLLLLVSVPAHVSSSSSSSCAGRDDAAVVAAAFQHVRNFRPPVALKACQPVRELLLPSRNLTGAVSWAALANLSALAALDLSGNALRGAIPGGFWRAPSLRAVDVSRNQLGGALRVAPNPRLQSLNVSGNRFSFVSGIDGFTGLGALDVSRNLIREVPPGLRRLTRVTRLDLSGNAMRGRFPADLPPLGGVRSLNVSYNNFSGVVDSGNVKKFGRSAFVHAGNASLVFLENTTTTPRRRPLSPPHGKIKKRDAGSRTEDKKPTKKTGKRRRGHLSVVAVAVMCGVASLAMLLCLVGCVACGRCRKNGGKDDEEEKKKPQWSDRGDEEEVGVVIAAAKGALAAPVVLFERPLMELTLADLAAATSGFGRESQLAERGGRSGAAYRAVLPGDLHVVVRVVEGATAGLGEDDNPSAAATTFRELARLRHPNILPLIGYCIAGKEKLLLYEYMEKGDLQRWLHELPAGRPDMDDAAGCGDIWETSEDKRSISDWPTRHRIALGIARGLAFLHQGWAGSGRAVVHGHLVPTNVLLGDDLEPRISDFFSGHPSGGGGESTPEGDVYGFGVVVLELMTGQARWDEASVSWARGIIRDGKGLDIVDPRIRDGAAAAEAEAEAAEREMVECLRVGYLCTAQSPDKRPTMQQVVGVLKDIRPAPATPTLQQQPA